MTKDVDEQTEVEGIGDEMGPDVEGGAPRRKGGGFWVVLTVIFVVLSAVLAWLYTVQLDELEALRTSADQATSRAVMLQQKNRQVSAELAELVEKLRDVVRVVDELEGVEELQPSAEEAAAEGKGPVTEAKPAEAATEAPEPEPAKEAAPAEKKPTAPRRPPGPRVGPMPPGPR